MEFDTIKKIVKQDKTIEYGIIRGNSNIVFIKSGKGGSCRGHNDKLLLMAKRINIRKGFTVITASNPQSHENTYDLDNIIIDEFIKENGIYDTSIFLIGSSNGAYQNILLAQNLKTVDKIICINMPLMINFQKATTILNSMELTEKIFVYGSQDPSVKYVPLLKAKITQGLVVSCIDGADHNFSEMDNEFILISDII